MNTQVSVSIDVSDIELALTFYTKAIGCEFSRKYNDKWQVVTFGGLDFHLQEKESGSKAAGTELRNYARHWTPVHLDFGSNDIRVSAEKVERFGGYVESTSFSEVADIAVCADPFGNGFCLIRE